MMTRQHYMLIAQTLRDSKADIPIVEAFVEAFVKVLEQDNPRFNADRFRFAASPLRKIKAYA